MEMVLQKKVIMTSLSFHQALSGFIGYGIWPVSDNWQVYTLSLQMVNSLLNTAQQLKGMIEHAKIQAEAAKDAAVTQVKLQAEAEKKEVQLKPVNRGSVGWRDS